MRLRTPRIKPVADDELNAEQQGMLTGFNDIIRNLKLFRTMLRSPDAMRGLMAWGNYIQSKKNDLQGREKEIVILRTSFLCKAAYEWSHHANIGKHAGLTEEEIEAIKAGADAHPWTPSDRILIVACDELMADHFIGDATWAEMARHFSEKQLMDIVLTSGHYAQVGKIVNTFGIQLDDGGRRDEDLIRYA
jgi:4-carboxymuconolactone decarboxylase